MSSVADDEILNDFLQEAEEMLERLNNELIELEQRPNDKDLLNAAFRAFHTIKGGAGFTGLVELVDICHVTEDVFDRLRKGEIVVGPEMMDLLLQSLDVVNSQFVAARDGQPLPVATPELVAGLAAMASGETGKPGMEVTPPDAVVAGAAVETHEAAETGVGPDPAEAALEALLGGSEPDAGSAETPATDAEASNATAGGDEIGDDEFEALLDSLHGVGGSPGGTAEGNAGAAFESMGDPQGSSGASSCGVDGGEEEAAAAAEKAPPPAGAASTEVAPKREPEPAPEADPGESKAAAGNAAPRQPPGGREETVRIDVRRLDQIMNLVGELVLARNRLKTRQQESRDRDLVQIAANVDRVTAEIQTAVMASRLQSLQKVFGRFPRIVRDLSRELGKKVDLSIVGADTELDKNLVDALNEPMVHLVRNAVDHGIETPEQRLAAGKPETGQLSLTARQEGDHVVVSIVEDGNGMDPEALRNRGMRKGVITAEQASRMTEAEALQIIFEPGFSTREEISDVSGRGVGMDSVKTSIEKLNGSVEIVSTPGAGTEFILRLPLTLAIVPTLMVVVAGQRFALPLSAVVETYALDKDRLQYVDDCPVLMVRNEPLPLYSAAQLLELDKNSDTQVAGVQHVVALEIESRTIGLIVGELLGQEEIVVKPLGAYVRHLPGLAGATITGDGRIALILDVAGMLRHAENREGLAARGG